MSSAQSSQSAFVPLDRRTGKRKHLLGNICKEDLTLAVEAILTKARVSVYRQPDHIISFWRIIRAADSDNEDQIKRHREAADRHAKEKANAKRARIAPPTQHDVIDLTKEKVVVDLTQA